MKILVNNIINIGKVTLFNIKQILSLKKLSNLNSIRFKFFIGSAICQGSKS